MGKTKMDVKETIEKVREVLPQLDEGAILKLCEENPEARTVDEIVEVAISSGILDTEEKIKITDEPAATEHVEQTDETRRAQIEADEAFAREIEREEKGAPAAKRAAGMTAEEQLRETRKAMAERWKEGRGGTTITAAAGGRVGIYDQIKEARARLAAKWKTSSPHGKAVAEIERKRIHTLADLDQMRELTATGNPDGIGKRAFDLTNEFRAKHGLPALRWSQQIAEVGREHSKNMAEGRVPFGHARFSSRASRMPGSRASAENVAMSSGLDDPGKVAVDGWIKSLGHRKNMLSHFELSGIGVITMRGKTFLTQLFSI